MVAPPVVMVLMVLVHVSQRGLNVRYELRHSVTASNSQGDVILNSALSLYHAWLTQDIRNRSTKHFRMTN